jgi:hypothetical protein
MQAKLRVRDGYRILQSYNNRVIKLSAEDDGVAFEQEIVRARIEEDALVFAPFRFGRPSPASIPSMGSSVSGSMKARSIRCEGYGRTLPPQAR